MAHFAILASSSLQFSTWLCQLFHSIVLSTLAQFPFLKCYSCPTHCKSRNLAWSSLQFLDLRGSWKRNHCSICPAYDTTYLASLCNTTTSLYGYIIFCFSLKTRKAIWPRYTTIHQNQRDEDLQHAVQKCNAFDSMFNALDDLGRMCILLCLKQKPWNWPMLSSQDTQSSSKICGSGTMTRPRTDQDLTSSNIFKRHRQIYFHLL